MALKTRWVLWQVLIPIFGPIVISAGVVYLWSSGVDGFVPNWEIIVDQSPWALIFFALTLVGATINELWPKVSQNMVLSAALVMTAFAITLYAAFIVIWRHNPTWKPVRGVYTVTIVLLVVSVILSYIGYDKAKAA